MSKEKHATHTPGPWQIIPEGKGVNIEEKETNWIVAQLISASKPDERLIVNSPEMYEMCKLFEECMEAIDGKDGYDASYELAKVREVLAKVDGGEG